MRMLRHYFIGDNLDDLEVFEKQLEDAGVETPQIHVLSSHDAELSHHEHLHSVQSLMRKDIVHSGTIAALVGLGAFTLVLVVTYMAGWADSAAGWLPFILLAIVMLGFCTWLGGLIGIEKPNYHFARFSQALENDKHIFFVDLEPNQELVLENVLKSHPQLESAGTGSPASRWLIEFQKRVPRFFKNTWP